MIVRVVDHLGGATETHEKDERIESGKDRFVIVARAKGSEPRLARRQEVDRRFGLIKEIPLLCRRACFPRVDLFSKPFSYLTDDDRRPTSRDSRRQIDGICIFKRRKLRLPRRSALVSRPQSRLSLMLHCAASRVHARDISKVRNILNRFLAR